MSIVATYDLEDPVTIAGIEYTKLEFLRPTGKLMKKADMVVGDFAKACKLIELFANVPPSVVDSMSVADIEGALTELSPFLRKGNR